MSASQEKKPATRPWNKGLLIGQKRPLLPKHVWSIRVRLEVSGSVRDLALFNLALDSKLRACDLVRLRIEDVFTHRADSKLDRKVAAAIKSGWLGASIPKSIGSTRVSVDEAICAHRPPLGVYDRS